MKGVISGLLIFKILPSDTRFDTLSLQLSNRTYSPLSGSVTWTGLDSTTDTNTKLNTKLQFCTVSCSDGTCSGRLCRKLRLGQEVNGNDERL